MAIERVESVELKLDTDQMQVLVSKAILDSLTPDSREALLANAIRSLLDPKANKYGEKSVIQGEFEQAAARVARSTIEDMMRVDTSFTTKIRSLFADAVAKALDQPDKREALVEKLAGAIGRTITGERY